MNAKEITSSEADINPDDPHLKLTAYRTCRNCQFVHKMQQAQKSELTGGNQSAHEKEFQMNLRIFRMASV